MEGCIIYRWGRLQVWKVGKGHSRSGGWFGVIDYGGAIQNGLVLLTIVARFRMVWCYWLWWRDSEWFGVIDNGCAIQDGMVLLTMVARFRMVWCYWLWWRDSEWFGVIDYGGAIQDGLVFDQSMLFAAITSVKFFKK